MAIPPHRPYHFTVPTSPVLDPPPSPFELEQPQPSQRLFAQQLVSSHSRTLYVQELAEDLPPEALCQCQLSMLNGWIVQGVDLDEHSLFRSIALLLMDEGILNTLHACAGRLQACLSLPKRVVDLRAEHRGVYGTTQFHRRLRPHPQGRPRRKPRAGEPHAMMPASPQIDSGAPHIDSGAVPRSSRLYRDERACESGPSSNSFLETGVNKETHS